MARFLLIHGAWHGAWCWHKMMPALAALGHEAVAIDLPGHGVDKVATAEVNLARYVERVGAALSEGNDPWVMVGHSMGGAVITAAAEQFPGRVAGLVYLTAIALASGESMASNPVKASPSEFLSGLIMSPDRSSTRFRPEVLKQIFYADCDAADITLASLCLVPQSTAVMRDPVCYSAERWGRIPRAYVVCTADRALTPEGQREMAARMGFDRMVELDTSHSPFFSAPDRLAKVLTDLSSAFRSGGVTNEG